MGQAVRQLFLSCLAKPTFPGVGESENYQGGSEKGKDCSGPPKSQQQSRDQRTGLLDKQNNFHFNLKENNDNNLRFIKLLLHPSPALNTSLAM